MLDRNGHSWSHGPSLTVVEGLAFACSVFLDDDAQRLLIAGGRTGGRTGADLSTAVRQAWLHDQDDVGQWVDAGQFLGAARTIEACERSGL